MALNDIRNSMSFTIAITSTSIYLSVYTINGRVNYLPLLHNIIFGNLLVSIIEWGQYFMSVDKVLLVKDFPVVMSRIKNLP